MDLGSNLSYIAGELVSSCLPGYLLRRLVDEIVAALASPTVRADDISMLLYKYKGQAVINAESALRWQKLENLVQLVMSLSNRDEASTYLRLMRSLIEDNPQHASVEISPSVLNMKSLETHDNMLTPVRNSSVYAESFENIDRNSDRRSIMSSAFGGNMKESGNMATLSSLSDPYYSNTVTEREIMKFIPYTLLATTSHVFRFEKSSVLIPDNVPNGESGILHLLFETGLLYDFLQRQLEKNKNSGPLSPLKMAFLAYLSEALNSYMGAINRITKSSQIQTLRGLYIEIHDLIGEFRIYHSFMDKFQSLRGDQLLSKIYSLRHHGDPLVKRVSDSLHNSLVSLYYEYLVNWLTRGELEPHQEFFVEQLNTTGRSAPTMTFTPEKIPSFISPVTANEVYVIGKTYLFLEKDCKEIQWAHDCNQKYSAIYASLKGNIGEKFQAAVHLHYNEITSYCSNVLENKYKLSDVLKILKDVLLMGKGDFIDQMIKNSSDFLQESSATLPSYKLTQCLQESIKQSSLKYMISRPQYDEIVNGIDARVLELGHGSVGWDVFTLDYLAAKPLSTVLSFHHNGGRKEYLRIFNFLWRIKKNDHFFQEQWLRHNNLARDFRRLRRSRPLVRDILKKMYKINALKNNVQHFNRKIEAYCFQCIIEKGYEDLQSRISSIKKGAGSSMNVKTLKSGLKVSSGILKPCPQLLHNLGARPNPNAFSASYTIDELKHMHDTFLHEATCHKLLDSTDELRKLGTFTNQYYPSTLIMALGDIFEFILRCSEFNEVIHQILIQLSLQSSDKVSDLLNQLNELLTKIAAHYKWIQKTCYYFTKDLRADGDIELANISRILR